MRLLLLRLLPTATAAAATAAATAAVAVVAQPEEAEQVMEEGQEGQEGQEDGPVYTGVLPCSVLLLRRQQIRRHCGGARGDGGVLKLCRGLDWCVRTPAGVVRWCLVGGGAADALATTATKAAAIATTTAQP